MDASELPPAPPGTLAIEEDTGASESRGSVPFAVDEALERARAMVASAELKNLFDLLPVAALQGKVVAVVAMGGSDHHFLGANRHLRDVLTFFGALPTPVSAYLTGADFADGAPSEGAARELDESLSGAVRLVQTLGVGSSQFGPESLGARFNRA